MKTTHNTMQRLTSIPELLVFLIFTELEIGIGICQSNTSKTWLPLGTIQTNQASPSIALTKATGAAMEFKVDVSGILISEFYDHGINLHSVAMPEYGHSDIVGKPMVPKILELIALPSSCVSNNITIQIIAAEFSVFKPYHLQPVPTLVKKRLPDGLAYIAERYIENPEAYSTNSFYPHEFVKIERTGRIRDQQVAWVAIYPVQYNPVTRELRAYHRIEVRLNFGGGQVLTEKGLGPWDDLGKELFLNYDSSVQLPFHFRQNEGRVTYPTNLWDPANSADYLVITTADLMSNAALDSLAHHRANLSGFDVAVVSAENVYQQFPAGAHDESIKNFIKYAYDHWQAPHFGDGHPGYVLLVGEGEQNSKNLLPTHFYSGGFDTTAASDHWYACVNDDDGNGQVDERDFIADLIIGRFSVEDHEELSVIAHKTIQHEQNLSADAAWRKKISLFSGFAPLDFSDGVMPFFEYIRRIVSGQNFYELAEALKRAEMDPNLVRNAFIEAINDGRAVVNVLAHGSVDVWGDAQGWKLFRSSDISLLSNHAKLPVILSLACDTGNFCDPEKDCLGEIFLNTPNRGAIAFLGASTAVGLYTNLARIIMEFTVKQQNLSLGVAFYYANFFEGPFRAYHLFGDPALGLAEKAQHGLADLSITPEDIEIIWSPIFGAHDTISAKVHNRGFMEAKNVTVQFFDGDPRSGSRQIGEDQVIDSVQGLGDYQTAKVLIDDVVEGELNVHVRIDPYNTLAEIEENNNTAACLAWEPIFVDAAAVAGVADTGSTLATAFGDYDNDGHLDIYVANGWHPDILYNNNGDGTFRNVAAYAGIADPGITVATTFVDYDNDGNLDIFLVRTQGEGNLFFHNNGDGTFNLITPLNAMGTPLKGFAIGFLDYDKDGLLDIYCLRGQNESNVLYRNNGHGIFTDVTSAAGLDSTIGGKYAAFGDFDNDGDLDIYLIMSYGRLNLLYQNNSDGTFSDVTQTAGVKYIMGADWAAFGDYDNDGDMDLFVSHGYFPNALYQNQGNGTFSDVAKIAGIDSSRVGYGTGTFLDYDNDGYLDLYGRYNLGVLFKSDGGSFFSKDTTAIPERVLKAVWCTAIGDYENDGDLDLYGGVDLSYPISRYKPAPPPANVLYRNKGNNNNWLIVKTRGTKSNSYGIGARIRVVSGNLLQIRDVTCSFAFGLQQSLPIAFGLGKHDQIDTVEVRWPSGTVDVLTSVMVNSILTVIEGYGDASIPSSYRLSQNYPNPFNQGTTIEYQLRETGRVTIEVFNLLGQKVMTLIDTDQIAGYHRILWDGKDSRGKDAASGVYIYRMKMKDFFERKKLVLIR